MTKGTIERAYELAPGCTTIEDIRNTLKLEGYTNVDAHLGGQKIKADLRELLNRLG